jgi:phosphate transport system permease protein
MMRLLMNRLFIVFSTLAALVGLFFLAWILFTLCAKGLTGLNLRVFTHDLIDGGLRNVIVGQLMISGIATLIGIPLVCWRAFTYRNMVAIQKQRSLFVT